MFYTEIDEVSIRKERNKANRLKDSQWWKRRKNAGICHYCRKTFLPSDLTMDHIVPMSRGGVSKKANVVPACKECNRNKRDLLPIEWEAYLEAIGKND